MKASELLAQDESLDNQFWNIDYKKRKEIANLLNNLEEKIMRLYGNLPNLKLAAKEEK